MNPNNAEADSEQHAGVTAIGSSSSNGCMWDPKEKDIKEATLKETNIEEKGMEEKNIRENDSVIVNTISLSSPPSTTSSHGSRPSGAKDLALPEQRGINDASRQLRRRLLSFHSLIIYAYWLYRRIF
jgi:hypothetical protein